jgi:transcriptional regulator with XRE-family HTH domain
MSNQDDLEQSHAELLRAERERRDWTDFGHWLAAVRVERGYTQAYVASRAGISTQNLVSLEHGGFRRRAGGPWTLPNPRDETLKALARVYRMGAEEMFRRVGHYADRPQTRAGLRRRASSTKRTTGDLIAELQERVDTLERVLREHGIGAESTAAKPRRRASG